MAELWLRLSKKSSQSAVAIVQQWRDGAFRLTRRLALFACVDPVVPSDFAADMLIGLPCGELFLAGASVEVYRLIRGRWKDLPAEKQEAILRRFGRVHRGVGSAKAPRSTAY